LPPPNTTSADVPPYEFRRFVLVRCRHQTADRSPRTGHFGFVSARLSFDPELTQTEKLFEPCKWDGGNTAPASRRCGRRVPPVSPRMDFSARSGECI